MITAAEFNERRAELIRLHEENPGKRGFGREATEKKIAALLGYTEENCNGYWESGKAYLSATSDEGSRPQFACPVKRPYARTSYLHIRRCPAGLFSPVLEVKFGKAWREGVQYGEEPRLSWPETQANNVLSTAFGCVVYDSFREAAFAAIDKANDWFGEEKSHLALLVNLVQNGADLPEACPLTKDQVQRSWQTIIDMQLWLKSLPPLITRLDAEFSSKGLAIAGESGLAVPESESAVEAAGDVCVATLYEYEEFRCPHRPPRVATIRAKGIGKAMDEFGCVRCKVDECDGPFRVIDQPDSAVLPEGEADETVKVESSKDESSSNEGQRRLAGEDVMPTAEPVNGDPELAKVKDKYDSIRLKIQTEKQAIKEIKEEALAPHKGEISEKESTIELMSFVMTLFEVQAARAEAKIKSKYEAPTFCVYAYTRTGYKGVRVQVGTKQDIRDLEFTQDGVHSYVLAEFLSGEDVTDREE